MVYIFKTCFAKAKAAGTKFANRVVKVLLGTTTSCQKPSRREPLKPGGLPRVF